VNAVIELSGGISVKNQLLPLAEGKNKKDMTNPSFANLRIMLVFPLIIMGVPKIFVTRFS